MSALKMLTIRCFLSFVMLLLLFLLPFTKSVLKYHTIRRAGGDILPYLEYLPANYSKCEKKFPVIVFLHGGGHKGDGSDASIERLAQYGPPARIEKDNHDMCFQNPSTNETECFVVISPQAPTTTPSWFPEFTMPLLAHLHSDAYTCLDNDRFYLTGLSMGGRGTFTTMADIGVHFPNGTIRAAAPVCGYLADPQSACDYYNYTASMWIFIGDQDVNYYPKCCESFEKIKTCSIHEPKLTIYWGMNHYIFPQVYKTDNSIHSPNLYQWFLAQTDSVQNKNPVDPVILFIQLLGGTMLFLLIAFNVSIICYFVYRNKDVIKKEVGRLSKRISRRISIKKVVKKKSSAFDNFNKMQKSQKEVKLKYPSRPKERPFKSKYYIKPNNTQKVKNFKKSNFYPSRPKEKPFKSKFYIKPGMKKAETGVKPPPVNTQIKQIIKSKYPTNVQKKQIKTKGVNLQKGQKEKQQFYVSARPKSKYMKELT